MTKPMKSPQLDHRMETGELMMQYENHSVQKKTEGCENADVTHLDMSEHGLHVDERA